MSRIVFHRHAFDCFSFLQITCVGHEAGACSRILTNCALFSKRHEFLKRLLANISKREVNFLQLGLIWDPLHGYLGGDVDDQIFCSFGAPGFFSESYRGSCSWLLWCIIHYHAVALTTDTDGSLVQKQRLASAFTRTVRYGLVEWFKVRIPRKSLCLCWLVKGWLCCIYFSRRYLRFGISEWWYFQLFRRLVSIVFS